MTNQPNGQTASRRYGLLLISHGSRDAEWVRLVDEAIAAARLPADMPVFGSFLELVEGRLIPDGIAALEGAGVTDLIVLPLFVSAGSTHIEEIRYALGDLAETRLPADLGPFPVRVRVHMGPTLDEDPTFLAEMVYNKLNELSVRPDRELVLLVGHGSAEQGFHARWRETLRETARCLRQLGGFAETDGAMLLPDQFACKVRAWRRRRPELTLLVAPLFLSEGYFTRRVVPARGEGLDYRYNGRALLPSPLLPRWIERQAQRLSGAPSTDYE
ncbi:hypothetical protein J31TS4_31550 [Paenibacillus sp. J31TS4]|uniref:sirohydrochlorin chelatase n=1 Tax=Paenibacillus sp. J31TS4 TaxID=2807195 RepID=UPI001B086CF0|nr:CbiX/SirB N-terminal domain-containing protein [Paenibacillus sp. J31TS4]GIP39875.1 hypothetical protein J31TS4_31550 [Paenibacillus sp. J31TS4]